MLGRFLPPRNLRPKLAVEISWLNDICNDRHLSESVPK